MCGRAGVPEEGPGEAIGEGMALVAGLVRD